MGIDPEAEARLKQVEARLLPLVGRLAEATIPLCQRSPRKRPLPAGSGILFQIQRHRFLLTASHVFEPAIPDQPLWAIAASHFVPLTGPRWRTRPRPEVPSDDRADVAIVPLGSEVNDSWSNCRFLSPGDIDPFVHAEEIEPTTGFLAIGYPDSKQPRDGPSGLYAPFAHHFVSHREVIHVGNECGGIPELHIAIGFDPGGFDGINAPQRLPDPRGMSGGGLWRIAKLFESEELKAVLVGVLIEYRTSNRLILATRIGELLAGIANRDPGMKPLLEAHFPGFFPDAA